MSLEIVSFRREHLPELGRICFEAFGALHDRHNVPRDFASAEFAGMVLTMLTARPDYVGFTAVLDGRIVGSNFLQTADVVAGVGPITVDPAIQSRGVGRALMQRVIDEARSRGRTRVRLFQEAVNSTSLPLYTTLGFRWVNSAVILSPPAESPGVYDGSIRPMNRDDLPTVHELSQKHYGHSRAEDAGLLLSGEQPMPGFIRERGGRSAGYFFPTFLGHGAAESVDDMVALTSAAAANLPAEMTRFICPLSEADLFRAHLSKGWRVAKLLSYMALEDAPFEAPGGVWTPSIQC